MYYGEAYTLMDDKNRIVIPTSFRRTMEKLGHNTWYITRGYDSSLFMFHEEHWQSLIKEIPGATLDPRLLDFRRFFLGTSVMVEPDSQGRILLSNGLRDYACLERNCVILGMEDHLEIWSKAVWARFSEKNMAEYRKMAAELFGTIRSGAAEPQEEAQHVEG